MLLLFAVYWCAGVMLSIIFVFFFFKQKTAYEMRIRDWSSDVCSSDLTEAFFRRAGITIEPVTLDHGELARQAFLDFGKGRHKAGLNFGDCFSYALAKATDEPLLFKGNDFALTDIEAAA